MVNIKIAPAITILAIINCLVLVGFYLVDGAVEISEPNEPPSEPNEPNEPITSIHISMISDDGEVFNKTYIGTESQIREALLKDGVIAEPNEPKKYSFPLPIPTWPDYIELDKGLEIEMPYKMWYGNVPLKHFIFPKGTKIYFKE